jgi:hypothetical protein
VAWALVRQNNYTDDTAYSTSTIALTISTVNGGSLLVLCINIIDGSGLNNDTISSITDSDGNTWAKAVDSQFAAHGYYSGIWYAANVAGDTLVSVTINLNVGTGTSKQYSVRILEYSGLSTSPLDVVASLQTASGTSFPTGTTAATAQANELAIATYADNQQAPAVTLPGGWTSRLNFTTDSTDLAIVEKDTGAIATQSATFTSVSTHYATGLIATFKTAAQIVVLPSGFFSSTRWPGPEDIAYRPFLPLHPALRSDYVPPPPPPTPGRFNGIPFPHWRRPDRYRRHEPLTSDVPEVSVAPLIVLLEAASAVVASVERQVNKIIAASSGSAASLQKAAAHAMVTNSATVASVVKQLPFALTTTSAAVASMLRMLPRMLAASSPALLSIRKQVAKNVTASSGSAGAIVKQVGKTISLSSATAVSMLASRFYQRALTAVSVSLATIAKQVGKPLSASSVTVASFIRNLTKSLTLSSASVSSIIKQATKTLSTSSASQATLSRVLLRLLSAASTVSSSIVKQVVKPLTVTVPSTPTIVKRVSKTITATSASVATLAALNVKLVTMAAISATTATISRLVGKPLAASSASVPTIKRAVNKTLSTSSATVSQIVKRLTKSLPATRATIATLVATGLQTVFLTVTSATVATIRKAAAKSITVSSPGVASVVKNVRKNLTLTLTAVASITRARLVTLAAASAVVASFGPKLIQKTLTGVTVSQASIRKGLNRVLTTVSNVVASLLALLTPRFTPPPPVLTDTAIATAALIDSVVAKLVMTDTAQASLALLDTPAVVGNLVANSRAQLGNNTNWSQAIYDAVNTLQGIPSFKSVTPNDVIFSDALMPIDPAQEYLASYWAKATTFVAGTHAYLGVSCYDVDGQPITSQYVMWLPNTLTTLAADLHPGDPTITLTSAANWYSGPTIYQRALLIWDYVDGSGKLWAPNTYSRHHSGYGAWAQGAISGNVITLATPWVGFGSVIPAGTPVSNANAGGTYMYCAAVSVVIPGAWTQYQGVIAGGYDATGTAPTNKWWPGTKQAKMLLLLNRDTSGNVTNFTDVTLEEVDMADTVSLTDSPLATVTLVDAQNG